MSTNTQKKTARDPVEPAVLQRLAEIQHHRFSLGDALLDLEQEKVKLIVQVRRLDDEKTQLFNQIAVERGLTPGVPIEINAQTGEIEVLESKAPQEAPSESS